MIAILLFILFCALIVFFYLIEFEEVSWSRCNISSAVNATEQIDILNFTKTGEWLQVDHYLGCI